MNAIRRILLLGDSLSLQSLGAGLQDSPDVEIVPPDTPIPPDVILLAATGGDLTATLRALERFPTSHVVIVDIGRQRLTALRVSSGPARTAHDLREALISLTS